MVERVDSYEVTGALARVGYAGRALVFILTGFLAARLATGDQQGDASGQGAIAWVDRQPFGSFMLTAFTLAIAAYALYSLAEAAGATKSGAADRVAAALRALVWAALAALAVTHILELRSGAGSSELPESLTARLLSLPGGRVLVGVVGLAVLAVAVNELRKSWRRDWEETLGSVEGSETARRIAYRLGRFGYAARGLAYGLVGWFFVLAALERDPDESGGLDQALSQTAATGWGVVALLMVAVGFVAYGVFCLFIARYRSD